MKIRKNIFKQQMEEGIAAHGIWNGIPHPYVAEICAGADFDWICIDAEHSPFSMDRILTQIQAIQSHDISAILRLPSADPILTKQYLELGVQNILAPMVESAEQAESFAKSLLYPPAGFRGIGTGLGRAAQWNRVNNYLEEANQEVYSMVQVETLKGVQALDEILEVTELGLIFLGPADLAASMGYLGQAEHPEVVKEVISCIKKIVQAKKAAGFLTGSADVIKAYQEAGALMLGVGADTLLLSKASKALADFYK
ncbi:MAG: HpcH/HpaI aldolase/citrate lyase family protein [Bacteroidota bacterium]